MKNKKYLYILVLLVLILTFFIFYHDVKQNITQKKYISAASEYYTKALIMSDQAKYDSAILYLERASRMFSSESVWEKYLDAEFQIGWTLIAQGAIGDAKHHFEQIFSSNRNMSDIPLKYNAYLLENTGKVYALTGEYREAIKLFQSALDIYSSIPEESQKETKINYLISVSENLAEYPQSDLQRSCPQNYFEFNLRLIEEKMQGRYPSIGYLFRKRMIWNDFFGDEEPGAIKLRYYLCELIDLRRKIVDMNPIYYLEVYDSIGVYYERKGKYENALAIFEMLSELNYNTLNKAYSLRKLGDIYFKEKDYENAQRFYSEFCTSLSQILTLSHPLIRDYCTHYANKFSRVNMPGLSDRFIRRSESIKEEMSLTSNYLLTKDRIKYQNIEIPDWLLLY